VVQTDSTRVELDSARVVGDTLVGVASGMSADADPARPVAVALSQVSQVTVRETDLLKTAAMIAVVLVLVAGLVFAVAFRQALWLWYEDIAEID
jgi:hypothetical protein